MHTGSNQIYYAEGGEGLQIRITYIHVIPIYFSNLFYDWLLGGWLLGWLLVWLLV